MSVRTEIRGEIGIVTIDRPEVRNAVDRDAAEALEGAFTSLEATEEVNALVLTGSGEHFCAGADLRAFAGGRGNRLEADGAGPMGPTRMMLSKPCIAAIEGYAVAGGLELAAWCDLRVVAESATLGVFCRRFGVPLIDGGTHRLPRLVGMSRALDLILTGRPVGADEALQIGLANRVVPDGSALSASVELAQRLCAFPQAALLADRKSAYLQWGMSPEKALSSEFEGGRGALGEALEGARRFAEGAGRHGDFEVEST